MKKIILSIALLGSLAASSFAQKGTVLLYGSVGNSRVSNNGNTINKDFHFSPAIGYQFDDNFTAGITADYNSAGVGTTTTQDAILVGPFLRYAQSLSPIFMVYGQLGAGFGSDNAGTASTGLTNVNLFPAVFVNLKKSFGLNFDFGGFNYDNVRPSGAANPTNYVGFNFGRTMNIGISKNF
jgi:hypothetical protein